MLIHICLQLHIFFSLDFLFWQRVSLIPQKMLTQNCKFTSRPCAYNNWKRVFFSFQLNNFLTACKVEQVTIFVRKIVVEFVLIYWVSEKRFFGYLQKTLRIIWSISRNSRFECEKQLIYRILGLVRTIPCMTVRFVRHGILSNFTTSNFVEFVKFPKKVTSVWTLCGSNDRLEKHFLRTPFISVFLQNPSRVLLYSYSVPKHSATVLGPREAVGNSRAIRDTGNYIFVESQRCNEPPVP